LFVPFRRGEVASQMHSGSGVGLSIARKLAGRAGVLLEVASAGRDKGTQVKLVWRKPK
jgi:signal transduction histidine kinase